MYSLQNNCFTHQDAYIKHAKLPVLWLLFRSKPIFPAQKICSFECFWTQSIQNKCLSFTHFTMLSIVDSTKQQFHSTVLVMTYDYFLVCLVLEILSLLVIVTVGRGVAVSNFSRCRT